jgi:hypothetical protein
MSRGDFSALDRAGLNLQAVFDLDALPGEVVAPLRRDFDPDRRSRQLILIGHAGRAMWAAVEAAGIASADPIDDFSVRTAEAWFAAQFAGHWHAIVYPGEVAVGLQTLGRLAGWHHPTPFMVGIQQEWGTWFAYRVAMLSDTRLAPTPPRRAASPCERCADRPCVSSCPAGAMADGGFALDKCVRYRREPASRCRSTCIARVSCPVGSAHRYSEAQMAHSYSISLQAIERYC